MYAMLYTVYKMDWSFLRRTESIEECFYFLTVAKEAIKMMEKI